MSARRKFATAQDRDFPQCLHADDAIAGPKSGVVYPNFLLITTLTVTPGNPRSNLGMAMWPLPTFTSGIYPRRQPQEQTALGCTIPRFSQFPDWHSEWCSELANPPPYGRTAFRGLP